VNLDASLEDIVRVMKCQRINRVPGFDQTEI